MHKAIFWDFDGVIVDSIDECLITSYNTFLKVKKRYSRFIYKLGDIPTEFKDEFYNKRKYVRPAGEYFVIFNALLEDKKIDSYSDFSRLLKKYAGQVRSFQRKFYAMRRYFMKEYPRAWLALHKTYPGFKQKWGRLSKRFVFYIVSNKDKHSILAILRHLGLPLNRNKIFGVEFSLKKPSIISHILEKTGLATGDVFFIDDNYHHLLDLSDKTLNLFFAAWGYGEMPAKMKKDIYPLELKNFDEYLLGARPYRMGRCSRRKRDTDLSDKIGC